MIVNKKKKSSGRSQSKIEKTEKRDKYQELARELKKTMEYEVDGDINCNWCARFSHQMTGRLKNSWESRANSNYSIVWVGQNTEEIQETKRDFLALKFQWKAICERWCEKLSK